MGKAMGQLGGGRWAQVHDFVPEDEVKLIQRGRLVAVLGVEGGDGGEEATPVETGREVLARLHELYYGEVEGGAGEHLVRAIERVGSEMEEGGVRVEVVAVVLMDEVIFVAAWGGGVWTRTPEGKEGWISRAGEQESVRAGVKSFSGRGREGQVIVIGNSRFWEGVAVGTLRPAVARGEGEWAEAVGTVLHGNDRGRGGAGAIIKIQGLRFKIQEEKPRPEEVVRPQEVKERKERWWEKWGRKTGPVYVEYRDRTKERKKLLIGGLMFLVILAAGAGVGWARKVRLDRRNSVLGVGIEELSAKLDEVSGLLPINPVRARQLVMEAGERLEELRVGGAGDERWVTLESKYKRLKEEAGGIVRPSPKEIIDLGLVREGMVGKKMVKTDEKLMVLDVKEGRLVEVNPSRGSGEVVAGGEMFAGAKLIASYPGKLMVLSNKGIAECPMVNIQCSIRVNRDESWGEISDMEIWAGNIYLLGRDQVWVYRATESGYGTKSAWLVEQAELGGNMAIDGNIWILSRAGEQESVRVEVRKYTRGVREDFGVVGVEDFGGDVIYTDGEAEKLYVLDSGNSRVVVFGKDGQYDRQYVLDQAGGASDVVVDEIGKKMYLLEGSKIWEVQL